VHPEHLGTGRSSAGSLIAMAMTASAKKVSRSTAIARTSNGSTSRSAVVTVAEATVR